MDNYEEATDRLDTTMDALATEVGELTPQSGKGVIDAWINALSESENTKEVVDLLQQLKTQLESGGPNPEELNQLLLDLSARTHEMGVKVGPEGDLPPRMEALAAALQTLAGKLSNA